MNRICLPVAKDYFQQIEGNMNPEAWSQALDDVKTSKWVIVWSILVAIAFSFLFIYFIEKCAGIIV